MNGDRLVLDTNILIYLLEGNQELKEILAYFQFFISFISEVELLSKKGISDNEQEAIKALLDGAFIIDSNQEVKSLTINNRINYGLKIPDSFVLATAQWLQYPLLTSDKEFEKAKESPIEIIIF